MGAKERLTGIYKKLEPFARVGFAAAAVAGFAAAANLEGDSGEEPTYVVGSPKELQLDTIPTIYPEITKTPIPTQTPTPAVGLTPTMDQQPTSVGEGYIGQNGTIPPEVLSEAIDFWCAKFNVDCADMHSMAFCESTYGQDPSAFDGSSGHLGPFQFDENTWLDTPGGKRGESANDPWAAAEGAAWMISNGRRNEWPNC